MDEADPCHAIAALGGGGVGGDPPDAGGVRIARVAGQEGRRPLRHLVAIVLGRRRLERDDLRVGGEHPVGKAEAVPSTRRIASS